MAAICDICGTKKNVKRAFITYWNGNILDACLKCAKPLLVSALDGAPTKKSKWLDNDGKG